jgi:CheY-like chemotaxis protein
LSPDKIPLIVMADDDEDDCTLAKDAFDVGGIQGMMHFAADGMELLEYLSGSVTVPSLILLDINMPIKNGRQTLKEIKSIPDFQNIPIIMLTTSHEQDDLGYCKRHGAKAFITKPAIFSDWVKMMQSLSETWLVNK